jgi:hypothetical protein
MPDKQSQSGFHLEHVQKPAAYGGLSLLLTCTCKPDALLVSSLQDKDVAVSPSSEKPSVAESLDGSNQEETSTSVQHISYETQMGSSDGTGVWEEGKHDLATDWERQPMMLPPPPPPPWHLKPPPPDQQANFTSPSLFSNSGITNLENAHDTARVNELEREHNELRDARDEVLGFRFRLQASRRELGDLRQATGAKDGFVFSMMRRLLLESGIELPQNVQQALDEASRLRDSLGLAEASYEEAEMKYNTLEWRYTREETKFIEYILDNNIVLGPRPRDDKEDPETTELTRFAGDLQGLPCDPMSTRSIIYTYPTDLEASDDQGGASATLREHTSGRASPGFTSIGTHSHPHRSAELLISSNLSQLSPEHSTISISPVGHIPQIGIPKGNDKGASSTQLAWDAKVKRIDKWLLDVLAMSSLQKAQLKAIHHLGFLTDDVWWSQVGEYWTSSVVPESVFHTGDSTVSSITSGSLVLTSATKTTFSVHSAVLVSEGTALPEVDHILEVDDRIERASGIDSADLKESGPHEVPTFTISHESTNVSVSTGPSPSWRTSASEESHVTATTSESSSGSKGYEYMDDQETGSTRERTSSTTSRGTARQNSLLNTPRQHIKNDDESLPSLEMDSMQLRSEITDNRTGSTSREDHQRTPMTHISHA